ncbi:excinuclease ABC C subunit domain protein [Isosphaera pallida ATCC 43644]|uniref:Excinuclease ABC C subunit domain protein n=1 Tax=Isosphaera pallida (strain ATCC 43644 / DSM 9630 / IS1B) TaxID=575540 RepID=E8R2K8_ISOPI|nr:UvrB/UvrC motif-containing protein [Isosphaera pallida]ADV62508.1 excinuclease ABC C subunit domain protein [Isosphaera pallida ATCC 43644]
MTKSTGSAVDPPAPSSTSVEPAESDTATARPRHVAHSSPSSVIVATRPTDADQNQPESPASIQGSAPESQSTAGVASPSTTDGPASPPVQATISEAGDSEGNQPPSAAGPIVVAHSQLERIRDHIRDFPTGPGVYLMKDARGRVVYIGKAKNLRSRVGSYFQKAAEGDPRIRDWIGEVAQVDYLEAKGEVDAMLMEARLIKDIQPRHNKELKDDKSFPYLQITTHEDFPRVNFTRSPAAKGVKLYGPFPRAGQLRGAIRLLQQVFQFRTCSLDIRENDPRWRWFRPCLLHAIRQCSAPCNLRIDKASYREDIRRLKLVLDGKLDEVVAELQAEMKEAGRNLLFEKAARIRDTLKALQNLNLRGDLNTHAQPEVFHIDPKRGLIGLRKVLELDRTPRRIDGVDIAHLGGDQTVGSLVTFVDGLPFKPGYRRYRIQSVKGIDDYASIREVVSRRILGLREREEPFPDIFLIDGGKGQLNAALAAFRALDEPPPTLISLAKREEIIHRPGEAEPLILSRRSFALRLLQSVRDEAHRFAQHYHHLLRGKKLRDE